MLFQVFMLFVLTMMSNEVEEDYFNSAHDNKECFKLCPETRLALHAHKTIDFFNEKVHERSKEMGDYISNDFKYVVANETKMNKESLIKYLEKLPEEQFVFIKCNNVYPTNNSITCNADFYGPKYGNVGPVRITFHQVEEKVLEFYEDF